MIIYGDADHRHKFTTLLDHMRNVYGVLYNRVRYEIKIIWKAKRSPVIKIYPLYIMKHRGIIEFNNS